MIYAFSRDNALPGSKIWHTLAGFPPVPPEMIEDGARAALVEKDAAAIPAAICAPRPCADRMTLAPARSACSTVSSWLPPSATTTTLIGALPDDGGKNRDDDTTEGKSPTEIGGQG
jgi:hypothetical protein